VHYRRAHRPRRGDQRAAARGEPWRFYDLGHGLCTYDFFDQCPHRMACAKCAFYRPKPSNLLRLKQDISLTDEETAAVDDRLGALDRLCAELADVPTPAGPTPRQLDGPMSAQTPQGGRDSVGRPSPDGLGGRVPRGLGEGSPSA
jgi:hypothetical protein